jgi:hypothetical protein
MWGVIYFNGQIMNLLIAPLSLSPSRYTLPPLTLGLSLGGGGPQTAAGRGNQCAALVQKE